MPRGGGGGGGGGAVNVSGYTRSNGTYVSGYTRSAPSSSSGGGYSGGGSVAVTGYTRSNGTYVSPYTRSAPTPPPAASSSPPPAASSRVQVSGYTRADGTEVSGHTRAAPEEVDYRNVKLQKERGNKYLGDYETHSSHVHSVEERKEFRLRPEAETLRNLRNQNEYTNLSVHRRIDEALLRMWKKGKFSMDEIDRGTPGDSSYIPPQEVHDRIVQKVKVAKAQSEDIRNPQFMKYLYKAADMADVDLRIFNGMKTGRASGAAAEEVGGAESQPVTHYPGTSAWDADLGTPTRPSPYSAYSTPSPPEPTPYSAYSTPSPAQRTPYSEVASSTGGGGGGGFGKRVEEIMGEVLADREWDNATAPHVASTMQKRIFELAKAKVGDGYKIIVMAEVLAPGSPRAKNLMQMTASDDYVIQAEVKNSKGMTGYCLVLACKYETS